MIGIRFLYYCNKSEFAPVCFAYDIAVNQNLDQGAAAAYSSVKCSGKKCEKNPRYCRHLKSVLWYLGLIYSLEHKTRDALSHCVSHYFTDIKKMRWFWCKKCIRFKLDNMNTWCKLTFVKASQVKYLKHHFYFIDNSNIKKKHLWKNGLLMNNFLRGFHNFLRNLKD